MKTIYFNLCLFIVLGGSSAWAQTLEEYLSIAQKNNPGLKAKQEAFEAALQRIPQVGSLPDPELSVSSFGQMVETRVGQQMARLSISQMIPWFGTLEAQKNAAAISAQADYDSYLDAQNELNFKVRATYYSLIETKQIIQLQEKNLVIFSSYKTLATTRFQNGSGTLADALRVDIMTNEVKTETEILKKKIKSLEVAFNKLLNRSVEEAINIPDEFVLPPDTEFSSEGIESHNPKLIELDKRISEARAQEQIALKQGMPRLGLGFDYYVTAKRPNLTFEDNGKDAWMPMLTVSLPIYRNKYKASVSEAKHMQQAFTEMKADMGNQLISDFEKTQFERNKADQELELWDKQIQQTQQILDLLLSAYENSGADFEEILSTQQMILKYEMNRASAAKDYLLAEAQLMYLMGQ